MKFWLGVLLITLMLSTACGEGISDAEIDATVESRIELAKSSLVAPTAAPVQTYTPAPVQILEPIGQKATVTRIIDGDTFDVRFESGKSDRVRLLGIDTPETFSRNKAREYKGVTDIVCLDNWGDKATSFAIDVLANKTIIVIPDPESDKRDYYDRLLAYIDVDDQDFGVMLLEEGYARVYIEGQSTRKNNYVKLEQQARSNKVGLWACSEEDNIPVNTGNKSKYDPLGPDRDCGDFSIWSEAQSFFKAAGGPTRDPHRLDGDNDGIACEGLMK